MAGMHNFVHVSGMPKMGPTSYTVGSIQFAPGTYGTPDHKGGNFFDGRIAPGIGSASKQTVDLGPIKDAIVKALDALIDLHGKLNAVPT
jgi:hypothetical protein